MIGRIRETVAIGWSRSGSKHCLPFFISFGWRDGKGFNPAIIGYVDRPEGRVGFGRFLFGGRFGRWDQPEMVKAARIEAEQIAGKLTRAQRSTLLGLGDGFCVLGCSEPYAIRLAEENSRRPALVEMQQGEKFKEFRLSFAGKLVREFL